MRNRRSRRTRHLTGRFIVLVYLGLLGWTAGVAWCEELTAEAVVRNVRAQDDAISDQTADVEIRSVDSTGIERATTLRLYWKNPRGAKGLRGQTLLVTLAPQHRKGESFLLWQAERANDSQAWLYLPDLRQALRITIGSQDAQGPARNADMLLGFEQLGARLAEQAERTVSGRTQVDREEYILLDERLTNSVAAIRRFYVSPASWTIARIEYVDANGRTSHTQTIEWQRLDGAWIWKRAEVTSSASSARTIVELRNPKVNSGLNDRLFTVGTLKSGTLQ